VATLGFFIASDPAGGPGARSASANIDYIEEQLDQIERQNAQGIKPPSEVLVELTNLTTSLSNQVAAGELDAPVAARLPALIERQQDAVSAAVVTSAQTAEPELLEAAQKLSEAGNVVAAAVAEPTNTSVAVAVAPTATSTPKPAATKPAATAVATATTEPSGPTAPVKPADLEPGQVLVQADVTDKTYATPSNPLPWVRVTTTDLTFVIAADWEITNITTDDEGLAIVESSRLNILTPNSAVTALSINLKTGEVIALINGVPVTLRNEKGELIDSAELLQLVPNRTGPMLHHFITSIEPTD
jgi:hypothetical protein